MAKRLYLVRHGQSKAQTEEEFSFDANLSDFGIEQSRMLTKAFSDVEFDKVFLSPLRRARQTFEHSGLKQENVFFDSRLVEELPAGCYDQILPYEPTPEYGEPDTADGWNKNIVSRLKEFLHEIYNGKHSSILIVAHAGVLSHLLNIFYNGTWKHDEIKYYKFCSMRNCAISVLDIDSATGNSILFWNCCEHLGELGTSTLSLI